MICKFFYFVQIFVLTFNVSSFILQPRPSTAAPTASPTVSAAPSQACGNLSKTQCQLEPRCVLVKGRECIDANPAPSPSEPTGPTGPTLPTGCPTVCVNGCRGNGTCKN